MKISRSYDARILLAVIALPLLLWSASAATQAPSGAPPDYEKLLGQLAWRELGPAIMGGRIDDVAVVESNPRIVYLATASGGVWKTENAGTTWAPIFDNEEVSTIGDITIAPSDPSIVWVGTGEPNNRQSSSWGNGVYKSTDAGRTWTHMGLRDTHHIGRLAIHPSNPEVVYVAALGRLWGPNTERGVFKTADGGRTWTRSLFINEDTGIVDLAMDPESPDILYAAAYQRRRTVFGYNGSGPHSGIYRTTDGGASWKKLSGGLPDTGETGRIGIAVYRKDPRIVYMVFEHAKGGVFRSDDRGERWVRMSDTNPRPGYYSKIHIDPGNDRRIWVLGAPMFYSEDGGKTFTTGLVQRIHGDYHAMWINPGNSDHMIVGSDGGIHWSYDRGRTWDYANTMALGQFYELGVDMKKPYTICGGLQDNGSWCGPSATVYSQGITNEDWFRVGGGDGFFVQIDPTDPDILYAESQDGNLFRRNMRTLESRSIRPQPREGEPPYRFQWNSPIVISAHDPKTIYYPGNFLFKSTDRGDTWEKRGGDLTTGVDRDKLAIMGRVPDRQTLSRHDGVQLYPTITTLSESPLKPGLLWAGTDDGNLQVTRDDGRNWRNVAERVPGVPKGTYVSRVVASRHAEGTAYVTFDGHRNNDFGIHVFMTADFGETWKPISDGIPKNNGIVNVIREHHRNPDLLFAGTEYGALVSFNRGARWHRLKANLPTVPVDDILIHPRDNDLIFGTHGRSIWVLDDITPLEQLNDNVLASDLHLFDVRPTTAWRIYGHKGSTGHKLFQAENPPYGAMITYYVKSKPAGNEKARIIVRKDGVTIREFEGPAEAGLNRVSWDLRHDSPVRPATEQPVAGAPGGPRGSLVDPGRYTVGVNVGTVLCSVPVDVDEDPRITISDADRAARRQALTRLGGLVWRTEIARRDVVSARDGLEAALGAWKKPGAPSVPEGVRQAAENLSRRIGETHDRFIPPAMPLGWAGPPYEYRPTPLPQRVSRLASNIEGYTAAPTRDQLAEIEVLTRLLVEEEAALKRLIEEELDALNRTMREAGIPHIQVPRQPR